MPAMRENFRLCLFRTLTIYFFSSRLIGAKISGSYKNPDRDRVKS